MLTGPFPPPPGRAVALQARHARRGDRTDTGVPESGMSTSGRLRDRDGSQRRADRQNCAVSKPVFELDGDAFTDVEGLWTHMSERLGVERWQIHSLDCLDDALIGGCGTPDGGFVLEWRRSDRSRAQLGADVFDR